MNGCPRWLLLLNGLLVVSTVAWSVPSHATPQERLARPSAVVEKVSFEAQAAPRTLACPATLRFRGIVVAATSGLVRYRFRSDDGTTTPSFDMAVKAKETREIVHLVRIGQPGAKAASGTLLLEVASSKGVQTAKATFAVTCVRESGEAQKTAGLSSTVLQRMVVGAGEAEGNLLEDFREQYLERRGYSLKYPFDNRRLKAYERLRAMRRAQDKVHRPAGWLNAPQGPGAPSTVDANQCAWSSTGPTNINGRVTHIAFDPTNHQRIFVTTVGGIWRSTDGARRWQRVSDDFLSTVFASVAINPSNPAEVFAGGGDPNYHGGWRSDLGIWRSTANGDPGSWNKVSPPELDGHVIYRLRIDPSAPNNVYAATSNGVYLGTRTGATIAFARLGGFDAWANDIVVDFSVNPHLVYAGVRQASVTYGRGVWKYDGTNWNQRNAGIPTASSRTINLALAQSNPSVLYAKVESNTGQLQGVYKTTTAAEVPGGGGNAWTASAAALALNDSCAGTFCYSWYNSTIEVDPANANIVWGGGLSIFHTPDGGTTWNNVWNGTDPTYPLGVHSDHHAVAFDPTNSKIVYVGDDGGIFRTTDTSAATWHWNNVSHGMVVTEFYRATSQQALAGIAAGGTQDNGTVITFGNRTWYQPGGCDGSDVAIDAADASTLYGNCNGGLFELTNPVPGTAGGGSQATWTLPAGVSVKSPLVSDPGVAGAALAAGTDGTNARLLKTTDGLNWNNASPTVAAGNSITTIGIAPSSAFQTYYVGISNGEIWRTINGGTNWTQTTAGLPAPVWTNSVYVDATNPVRAVAATSNGIYLTIDTGAHWDSIAGTGSTALPTNAITGAVLDPNDANAIYAVTDIGAFRGTITPAMGATPPSGAWTPFDEGLPDGLDINDLWVNRTNTRLKIGSMGHGASERDIHPGITCPSTRVVVRDNVIDRGETPSPSGVPDPEHPIPDAARPGFYKPDDTTAGRLYWWSSTDVRIDVPSATPAKNQIASADHVEAETCPIHLSDCPAGTIRDADPQRGQAARVYAQVNNMGLQPATNVRVTALFADASAGLPLLPNDFWTTTFPAGSSTCGALTPGSGWQFADPAIPCHVIPVVNPELPETVRFGWNVPLGQAGHSCMLIISESVTDPLQPSVRATNERRLWELVPNNRQISLRNLHVIDAPPAPAGGAPKGMESMNVPNHDRELRYVDLIVSRVDLPKDAVLGFLLPTAKGVESKGAQVAKIMLDAKQQRLARELKVTPTAFYRVTDAREAHIRLPVPSGKSWRLGLVYDAGKIPLGSSARFSVIAKQGSKVLGGNTYIIRSTQPKRSRFP
jgi:hypothetical protein